MDFCVCFRLVNNRRCPEQSSTFMPCLINSRACGAGVISFPDQALVRLQLFAGSQAWFDLTADQRGLL